ncbi:MAG: hypothetical protein J0G94_18240, partial [Sphingomonadales bacterium]|nr:hypothetical protein [Sphingomonadales bacterium]
PVPMSLVSPEPEVAPVREAEPAAAPREQASPIAQQIAEIAERIGTPPAPPVAEKKKSPSRAAELPGAGRKAAFTLRLDAERHLRLRLMSALSNRSAQHLLTEALDALIARDDALKALADQVESGQVTAAPKRG